MYNVSEEIEAAFIRLQQTQARAEKQVRITDEQLKAALAESPWEQVARSGAHEIRLAGQARDEDV